MSPGLCVRHRWRRYPRPEGPRGVGCRTGARQAPGPSGEKGRRTGGASPGRQARRSQTRPNDPQGQTGRGTRTATPHARPGPAPCDGDRGPSDESPSWAFGARGATPVAWKRTAPTPQNGRPPASAPGGPDACRMFRRPKTGGTAGACPHSIHSVSSLWMTWPSLAASSWITPLCGPHPGPRFRLARRGRWNGKGEAGSDPGSAAADQGWSFTALTGLAPVRTRQVEITSRSAALLLETRSQQFLRAFPCPCVLVRASSCPAVVEAAGRGSRRPSVSRRRPASPCRAGAHP